MSKSRTFCLYFIVLPLLFVVAALVYRYVTLDGGAFSLMSSKTIINYPANYHSRARLHEYANYTNRYFFQWWNFLIYDAVTHDHFTLVYHASQYSSVSNMASYACATMIHRRGPQAVVIANHELPISSVVFSQHDWSAAYMVDGVPQHQMVMIDDDTYRIEAAFLKQYVDKAVEVKWNLTFHRVHGQYPSLDNEQQNIDMCSVTSTLFGYHSLVEGTLTEGDKVYTFDLSSTSRYRAYAAGSWGCQLPSGYPQQQYPWTWFWLVIPNATLHAPFGDQSNAPSIGGVGRARQHSDIGMVFGTARFQTNSSLVGDLYGGYGSVGIGEEIVTASFVDLRADSSLTSLPLLRNSTHGRLATFDVSLDDWTTFHDESGSANIPLKQLYVVKTSDYLFQISFNSSVDQYFRCPVLMEYTSLVNDKWQSAPRLFSDYRAVGVWTHVLIKKRLHVTDDYSQLVYDGVVDTMNALEYAYESPVEQRVMDAYVKPHLKQI